MIGVDWLDYFRKWAPKYEREVEAYGYEPEKLFRDFIPLIGRRKSCLDVGCGSGKSLEVVDKICDAVIGVDPVERMAKQAHAKGFNALKLKGEDIDKLEGKFDLITFFASIDYMNAEKAARAAAKKLELDGELFLTVEPQNEERVLTALTKAGFEIQKRTVKTAYKGQKYVCLLLKQQLNRALPKNPR